MTKLLVSPVNLQNFNNLIKKNIDGFIFGIKDYSVFFNYDLNIEDISSIKDKTDKEIYIAINKMIYNDDLDNIKNILIEINNIGVSGVIFEDLSILNIVNELKLNINLIYNQIHFATNYYSADFWYEKGIKNIFLSTELMLKDYIDIKKNTKMCTFIYTYGYVPIFYSSRQLLTNYFKYINKDMISNHYYISNKNTKYLIYEKNNESFIFNDVLNAVEEVKDMISNNIDYIVLNGFMQEEESFNDVVDIYIKALNGENIDKLYINMKYKNKGFLFTETIYRVKS
jgi:putative protease